MVGSTRDIKYHGARVDGKLNLNLTFYQLTDLEVKYSFSIQPKNSTRLSEHRLYQTTDSDNYIDPSPSTF